MLHYTYLIIGGGMAADAACRGVRQHDSHGSIGLISEENDPPYNRPPLSKGLWKRTPLSRIWRGTESLGVSLHLGRRVVALDAARMTATDDQGERYTCERMLLATGGSPVRPRSFNQRVLTYRYLADYQQVREQLETAQTIVIIGGGFIGAEMAAALSTTGKAVSMVFPEPGVLGLLLPAHLSAHLNTLYTQRGVRVMPGEMVASVQEKGSQLAVETQSGAVLTADLVIAGLGIRPNTGLAQQAGLRVEDGIWVDEQLQTTAKNIFAAGDVINFFNPTLARRLRVEHEEHANQSGLTAGENMAGAQKQYHLLPSVYSTLFDWSLDAIGLLNPAFDITESWQEPYRKGQIYYHQAGKVVGALLINMPGQIDSIRQIMI